MLGKKIKEDSSSEEEEEAKSKMIKKGALLDGLDLNTGYDMYQQIRDQRLLELKQEKKRKEIQ